MDKENLTKDGSGNYILDPYILVANEMTTEYCSGSGYSDDRMTAIETWLTAHVITASVQQQIQSEGAGGVSQSYAINVRHLGSGFKSTRYGVMACQLDTAGSLLRASARMETGRLPNKSPIYGGRGDTNPISDWDEPGFYPG